MPFYGKPRWQPEDNMDTIYELMRVESEANEELLICQMLGREPKPLDLKALPLSIRILLELKAKIHSWNGITIPKLNEKSTTEQTQKANELGEYKSNYWKMILSEAVRYDNVINYYKERGLDGLQ